MTHDNVIAGTEQFKLPFMLLNFRIKYAIMLKLKNK